MAKGSNTMLNAVNRIIDESKHTLLKTPRFDGVDVIRKHVIGVVEGFFYSNIIINFQNNLTKENLKECNISEKEANEIKKRFKEIFDKSSKNLKEGSSKKDINFNVYQKFKKDLNNLNKNASKLLLEVENFLDIKSCEESIEEFKEESKNLGKSVKIGTIRANESSDEDYEDDE